jgi:hypothetical protein
MISEHFSLEELIASETADRHGLDNTPNADVLANLTVLAGNLEEVRTLLGYPIHVNSAYRSLAINALLGSKPTSAHTKGLAADIVCPQFGTPKDIVNAIISSGIQYDQVILEFDSWCHIGFCTGTPRLEKLVINKTGTSFYN